MVLVIKWKTKCHVTAQPMKTATSSPLEQANLKIKITEQNAKELGFHNFPNSWKYNCSYKNFLYINI